ncbi:MAG TPA: hypothetical protein VFA83_00210 [Acidimicrobiales bacterium]|nr:hypothetical protein [Acidimicrobiales bacterium]
MTPTRRRRGAPSSTLAVAGAVGAAVAVIALIAWLQSDNGQRASTSSATTSSSLGRRADAERAASKAWSADAQAAFGGAGIAQRVTDLVNGAHDWLAGTLAQDEFKARLDDDVAAFAAAQEALGKLRPYPYDKRVNDIFGRTAALYLDSVRVYEAALAVPTGEVRTQYDLLARRLRLLGDRVFDRGQTLIDAHLYEAPSPAVEIRKPEEVPNWVAEGLAPGPPLDAAPPPPASEPMLRQASRPQQPRTGWLKAVAATNAPTSIDVIAALDSQDPGRLATLATRLVAAAEKLRNVPDPKGDREESARYRLGLLVFADAARTDQLSTAMLNIAQDVALTGTYLTTPP